ncbi:MAG: hypothetical protein KDK70_42520, partial [Myxococcales bacterium]|nr:hypothetical protein [Myxococcales bacterium]
MTARSSLVVPLALLGSLLVTACPGDDGTVTGDGSTGGSGDTTEAPTTSGEPDPTATSVGGSGS